MRPQPSPRWPPEYEAKFWQSVKEILIDKYRHSQSAAQEGITRYRREIDRHGFSGAAYNQGEERAAEMVHGSIQTGLPGDHDDAAVG